MRTIRDKNKVALSSRNILLSSSNYITAGKYIENYKYQKRINNIRNMKLFEFSEKQLEKF